jgi:hypothetical protein
MKKGFLVFGCFDSEITQTNLLPTSGEETSAGLLLAIRSPYEPKNFKAVSFYETKNRSFAVIRT